MTELRKLWVVIPTVVLAGLLAVLFFTRGTMEELSFLRQHSETAVVDERPYQTAQTLAGLAVSAEEQGFAQEAERIADHEVDQAFAGALREAGLDQKPLSGEAAQEATQVAALKQQVKDDQAQVDALTKAATASGAAPADGDAVDIAKAQLGLDQDELADETQDLARMSGDRRAKIQQQLASREAALKKAEASGKGTGEMAVTSVRRYGTLWGRLTGWFEQRSRAKLLQQAADESAAGAKELAAEHAKFEGAVTRNGSEVAKREGADRVRMLQRMATRRVVMSILDDRQQSDQELTEVYGRWQQQVWLQHRLVGYLVLESLAWVAAIILLLAVARVVGRRLVQRMVTEPRQRRTLETILLLALEILGAVSVLLVVFGPPGQVSTILGLATAGLTVVFQDYILAFFGWFVLMGRNGIRAGDWVEIDSVGGEVAEIGLFRTTLLETGNWTSRGHPTGRRVTFINSFAIRGQYFNFSTHGQWMWDEIKLNVPARADAYELIKRMQSAVEQETAQDAGEAEREWRGATREVGLSQFSARPTVELRPANSGVDVIVRFVTRAQERFELSNRIYQAMLGLMEGTERLGS